MLVVILLIGLVHADIYSSLSNSRLTSDKFSLLSNLPSLYPWGTSYVQPHFADLRTTGVVPYKANSSIDVAFIPMEKVHGLIRYRLTDTEADAIDWYYEPGTVIGRPKLAPINSCTTSRNQLKAFCVATNSHEIFMFDAFSLERGLRAQLNISLEDGYSAYSLTMEENGSSLFACMFFCLYYSPL
jgi:hypothetical protein